MTLDMQPLFAQQYPLCQSFGVRFSDGTRVLQDTCNEDGRSTYLLLEGHLQAPYTDNWQ